MVEVTCGSAPGSWWVQVADSGPGFDPAELAGLFDPFVRGREARAAHAQGMGLGLAVVQEVITLHHGTIDVSAEPGRGATVRLVLPLVPPEYDPGEARGAALDALS